MMLLLQIITIYYTANAQTTTTTTLLPSQIKMVDICKMLDASKATGEMKTKILDARTKAGCP